MLKGQFYYHVKRNIKIKLIRMYLRIFKGYKVDTVSTISLTVSNISMPGLKSIGQFLYALINDQIFLLETDGQT